MINTIIWAVFQVITFVIIVDVILSYFMSPDQPLRNALDKIVNPMLAPIRKVVPPVMNFDLSPIILIVLLDLLQSLLLRIL
jgi:YggT family protein